MIFGCEFSLFGRHDGRYDSLFSRGCCDDIACFCMADHLAQFSLDQHIMEGVDGDTAHRKVMLFNAFLNSSDQS